MLKLMDYFLCAVGVLTGLVTIGLTLGIGNKTAGVWTVMVLGAVASGACAFSLWSLIVIARAEGRVRKMENSRQDVRSSKESTIKSNKF